MKVFLTGAGGFVGNHVARRLIAEGHSVYALVRTPGKLRPLEREASARIHVISGDLMEPAAYAKPLMECDAVIHLVGIIRESPRNGATFRQVHIEGTCRLVDAACKAGIGRFLHMSALGARAGAVSEYHRSKYAAEQIVADSGLPYLIFRPSVIFGPGDEFVNMLARLLRSPVVPVIGSGDYRLQPVSVHTVAEIFVKGLDFAPMNQAFEVGGPAALTYNHMLRVIGSALGKRPHLLHQPLWLMQPFIRVMERFPFFPITTNQLTMLLEENICREGNRFVEAFGIQEIPFEKGIREYI